MSGVEASPSWFKIETFMSLNGTGEGSFADPDACLKAPARGAGFTGASEKLKSLDPIEPGIATRHFEAVVWVKLPRAGVFAS